MNLEQYQQIIQLKDPLDQLRVLGYIKPMSVSEAKTLIKKELSLEFEPKLHKSFKVDGRKFKLLYDIEDMDVQNYALFKQIVGDIYSNKVDFEDNEIIVPDQEKYNKLFLRANTIIAIFSEEILTFRTLFNKKLNFNDKVNLFLKIDAQTMIDILFFYLNVIENLQMNGRIYYMQKINQVANQMQE